MLLIVLQINYKLFIAARDKSAMDYEMGRFDTELEPNVNPSCEVHGVRSTVCPRHSHDESVKSSLPGTHIRNISASTVSHMLFLYHTYNFDLCAQRIKIDSYFTAIQVDLKN